MSTREYAINDYGFIVDEQTMQLLAKKIYPGYTKRLWDKLRYDIEEKVKSHLGLCSDRPFTGEVFRVLRNGEDDIYPERDYCEDEVCFLPTYKAPTLFSAAYRDMTELTEEFRSRLQEYLPPDFDYVGHICHIIGVYYG